MKNTFLIIGFLCCIFSCTLNHHKSGQEEFIVTVDTLKLHFKGLIRETTQLELTHAVKLNGAYYCVFWELDPYYYQYRKRRCFVISESGIIENELTLPEISYHNYWDLFVKNDTILIKENHKRRTYYYDLKLLTWVQQEEADDVIFEDEDYSILSRSRDEHEHFTWFRDKHTGKEYELNSSAFIANKIDSSYYLSSYFYILKINDPRKLMPCAPEYYYHATKSQRFVFGSMSMEGVEILYGDSAWFSNYIPQDPENDNFILTSFKNNNKLYHIYLDTAYHIAKCDSGRFIDIMDLDFDGMGFELLNSQKMKIQKDNSQLIWFETDYSNLYGLLDIKDNKIDIRYLKFDIDTVEYLKTDAFSTIFDFAYSHIDSLHINTIDSLERALGSTKLDWYHNRYISHYFPGIRYFDFEATDRYLKTQDEVIANIISYDYIKNDSLVKSIFIEWAETKTFIDNYTSNKEKRPIKSERFKNKLDEIEFIVTDILKTKPQRIEGQYNSCELIWKGNNGLVVKLSYENHVSMRIDMLLYKE